MRNDYNVVLIFAKRKLEDSKAVNYVDSAYNYVDSGPFRGLLKQ